MKTNVTNEEAERENINFWNEVAPVHYKSYNIDSLLQGNSQIDGIQKRDIYPVDGKEILHLQCHIGTDTLSLAMDGAQVTGVDFSEESIKIARKLQEQLDVKADFVCSNIYDLKKKLSSTYDIVYTSKGVLAWLKSIEKWGELISHFLKDNGVFYMMEIHPMKYIFDDTREHELVVKHPYFHNESPTMWGDDEYPDYSDKNYIPEHWTYEWNWTLSDIVNTLIQNGLAIEQFDEYDTLFYNGHPGMKQDENGWWYLEKYKGKIPYTFTIKARKTST
ncbi:MAG: class I SAM-dependent methyltransferase [bacterium]|nr:class I SAM-dependent methyltransferase [bacterium]